MAAAPPPGVPGHLDVRMQTWERVLGPQFQQQRVLQWTPEAQRVWDAQRHGTESEPQSRHTRLVCGMPLWVAIVLGAIVLLLLVLLVVGAIKWHQRNTQT